MNDRSSEQINYNELKFSREQGFFDKSLAIRWTIGFLFALSLFFVLHFREKTVEMLELNTIAPGYIVSQVDFDFFDEEATIILKQEAVRDIGKIYQINEKEIRQRRIEFENFLIYNQDWRKAAEKSSFEDLYKGIDILEKALANTRFTDPRTLKKLHEVGVSTSNYQIYTPADLNEGVVLPPQIWEHIKKNYFPEPAFSAYTTDFIVDFFQKQPWILQEDIPAQSMLGKKIKAHVPEKYTHVSAGNRIIDQGEKVTARHVAMLQSAQKVMKEKSNLWYPLTLAGSLIMAMLLTGICAFYFHTNQPQILSSNRKLFLLVTIVVTVFFIAKLTEFLLISSKSNLIDVVRYPLFVPFAAILLCSLINASVATFAAAFLTIIFTMTLAFDPGGFMIINLGASLVAILTTRSLKKRKEIFVVCGKAWVCCIIMVFSIHFYHNILWNFSVVTDLLSTGVSLLLTAILAVGLLPLLESAFRVMTDVTLMEYMDPNNDLLRRLTIEAPGTYQHSVVVGNLAEAAALAIGANGLFCRVSTMYHDIGKMVTPQYFTENQQGGVNIHQLLTAKESAHVIIAHVSEGVAMARKAGLPEQFIDIIKEHHGTTLVYYFYCKELEKMGSDKSLVDSKDFRYAGPKPRSKESAIIMIADSLEAASRSLEKQDEVSLSELAARLIREKAEDGQFDHCLLTFEELAIVKSTLVKTLVAYRHSRVKYPARESKNEEGKLVAISGGFLPSQEA